MEEKKEEKKFESSNISDMSIRRAKQRGIKVKKIRFVDRSGREKIK